MLLFAAPNRNAAASTTAAGVATQAGTHHVRDAVALRELREAARRGDLRKVKELEQETRLGRYTVCHAALNQAHETALAIAVQAGVDETGGAGHIELVRHLRRSESLVQSAAASARWENEHGEALVFLAARGAAPGIARRQGGRAELQTGAPVLCAAVFRSYAPAPAPPAGGPPTTPRSATLRYIWVEGNVLQPPQQDEVAVRLLHSGHEVVRTPGQLGAVPDRVPELQELTPGVPVLVLVPDHIGNHRAVAALRRFANSESGAAAPRRGRSPTGRRSRRHGHRRQIQANYEVQLWREGMLLQASSRGGYEIALSGEDTVLAQVPVEQIRLLWSSAAAGEEREYEQASFAQLWQGRRVQVIDKDTGERWNGVVKGEQNASGGYAILYDDYDFEDNVQAAEIFVRKTQPKPDGGGDEMVRALLTLGDESTRAVIAGTQVLPLACMRSNLSIVKVLQEHAYIDACNFGITFRMPLPEDSGLTSSAPSYGPDAACGITSPKRKPGLIIVEVEPGGPAAAAELREGDTVHSALGIPLFDLSDWETVRNAARVGQLVRFEYTRGGLRRPHVSVRAETAERRRGLDVFECYQGKTCAELTSDERIALILLCEGALFPLARAVAEGWHSLASALLDLPPVRLDVNAVWCGRRPLELACEKGYVPLVSRLLDQRGDSSGADPNAVSLVGNAPLYCAVRADTWAARVMLVRLLLRAGAVPRGTNALAGCFTTPCPLGEPYGTGFWELASGTQVSVWREDAAAWDDGVVDSSADVGVWHVRLTGGHVERVQRARIAPPLTVLPGAAVYVAGEPVDGRPRWQPGVVRDTTVSCDHVVDVAGGAVTARPGELRPAAWPVGAPVRAMRGLDGWHKARLVTAGGAAPPTDGTEPSLFLEWEDTKEVTEWSGAEGADLIRDLPCSECLLEVTRELCNPLLGADTAADPLERANGELTLNLAPTEEVALHLAELLETRATAFRVWRDADGLTGLSFGPGGVLTDAQTGRLQFLTVGGAQGFEPKEETAALAVIRSGGLRFSSINGNPVQVIPFEEAADLAQVAAKVRLRPQRGGDMQIGVVKAAGADEVQVEFRGSGAPDRQTVTKEWWCTGASPHYPVEELLAAIQSDEPIVIEMVSAVCIHPAVAAQRRWLRVLQQLLRTLSAGTRGVGWDSPDEDTGLQAVAFAVINNDIEVLTFLLKTAGASADLCTLRGDHYLGLAAEHCNDIAFLELLARHGARTEGTAALAVASRLNKIHFVRHLLQAGAAVGDRLGKLTAVEWTCWKGDPPKGEPATDREECLLLLIESGARANMAEVVRSGYFKALHVLLEKGSKGIDSRDLEGNTALHWACQRAVEWQGDTAAVAALLQHGADVRIHNDAGHGPLWVAVSHGRSSNTADVVGMLLQHGAPVLGADVLGPACAHGDARVVSQLLAADCNLGERHEGLSLLEVSSDHPEIMRLLLSHPNAEVNIGEVASRGLQSFEALEAALWRVRSKGCLDVDQVDDSYGRTALAWTCSAAFTTVLGREMAGDFLLHEWGTDVWTQGRIPPGGDRHLYQLVEDECEVYDTPNAAGRPQAQRLRRGRRVFFDGFVREGFLKIAAHSLNGGLKGWVLDAVWRRLEKGTLVRPTAAPPKLAAQLAALQTRWGTITAIANDGMGDVELEIGGQRVIFEGDFWDQQARPIFGDASRREETQTVRWCGLSEEHSETRDVLLSNICKAEKLKDVWPGMSVLVPVGTADRFELRVADELRGEEVRLIGVDDRRRGMLAETTPREELRRAPCSAYVIARRLIAQGASVNAVDEGGKSVLFLASEGATTQIVRFLIEQGARVPGSGSLCAAARRGHAEVTRALLEAGASPVQTWYGHSAVDMAATEEVVQLLADAGSALSISDCVRKGWTELACELCQRHPDKIDEVGEAGVTAVENACKKGDAEALGFLIQRGARLNRKNALGEVPLFLAARAGHADCVEALLGENADGLVRVPVAKSRALTIASHNGDLPLVRRLLELAQEHEADALTSIVLDIYNGQDAFTAAATEEVFTLLAERVPVAIRERHIMSIVKKGWSKAFSRVVEVIIEYSEDSCMIREPTADDIQPPVVYGVPVQLMQQVVDRATRLLGEPAALDRPDKRQGTDKAQGLARRLERIDRLLPSEEGVPAVVVDRITKQRWFCWVISQQIGPGLPGLRGEETRMYEVRYGDGSVEEVLAQEIFLLKDTEVDEIRRLGWWRIVRCALQFAERQRREGAFGWEAGEYAVTQAANIGTDAAGTRKPSDPIQKLVLGLTHHCRYGQLFFLEGVHSPRGGDAAPWDQRPLGLLFDDRFTALHIELRRMLAAASMRYEPTPQGARWVPLYSVIDLRGPMLETMTGMGLTGLVARRRRLSPHPIELQAAHALLALSGALCSRAAQQVCSDAARLRLFVALYKGTKVRTGEPALLQAAEHGWTSAVAAVLALGLSKTDPAGRKRSARFRQDMARSFAAVARHLRTALVYTDKGQPVLQSHVQLPPNAADEPRCAESTCIREIHDLLLMHGAPFGAPDLATICGIEWERRGGGILAEQAGPEAVLSSPEPLFALQEWMRDDDDDCALVTGKNVMALRLLPNGNRRATDANAPDGEDDDGRDTVHVACTVACAHTGTSDDLILTGLIRDWDPMEDRGVLDFHGLSVPFSSETVEGEALWGDLAVGTQVRFHMGWDPLRRCAKARVLYVRPPAPATLDFCVPVRCTPDGLLRHLAAKCPGLEQRRGPPQWVEFRSMRTAPPIWPAGNADLGDSGYTLQEDTLQEDMKKEFSRRWTWGRWRVCCEQQSRIVDSKGLVTTLRYRRNALMGLLHLAAYHNDEAAVIEIIRGGMAVGPLGMACCEAAVSEDCSFTQFLPRDYTVDDRCHDALLHAERDVAEALHWLPELRDVDLVIAVNMVSFSLDVTARVKAFIKGDPVPSREHSPCEKCVDRGAKPEEPCNACTCGACLTYALGQHCRVGSFLWRPYAGGEFIVVRASHARLEAEAQRSALGAAIGEDDDRVNLSKGEFRSATRQSLVRNMLDRHYLNVGPGASSDLTVCAARQRMGSGTVQYQRCPNSECGQLNARPPNLHTEDQPTHCHECGEHLGAIFSGKRFLDKLRVEKKIVSLFGVHDDAEVAEVREEWALQPLRRCSFFRDFLREASERPSKEDRYLRQAVMLNNYLGSEIAFYFSFIAFYVSWLLPLTLSGFAFTIPQIIYSRMVGEATLENEVTLANGAFVIAWAQIFLLRWKRKSSELASLFGTRDYEKTLDPSEKFLLDNADREKRFNPITGRLEPDFREVHRLPRQVATWTVTALCVGVVILACWGNLVLRYDLDPDGTRTSMSVVSGVVNALTIIVLDVLYTLVAEVLSEFENHRTRFEHDQAQLAKLFIFRYINGFSGLLGPFLLRPPTTTADSLGPSEVLGMQLATLLFTQFVIASFKEKVLVVGYLHWATRKIGDKVRRFGTLLDLDSLSAADRRQRLRVLKHHEAILFDSVKPSLDDGTSTALFDDYSLIAVQFGYVISFASVLPLAPLFAMILAFLELQSDLYKYLVLAQRPMPERAGGIGVWVGVFNATIYLAIPINAIVMFNGSRDAWRSHGWLDVISEWRERPDCRKAMGLLGTVIILLGLKALCENIAMPVAGWVFNEDLVTARQRGSGGAAGGRPPKTRHPGARSVRAARTQGSAPGTPKRSSAARSGGSEGRSASPADGDRDGPADVVGFSHDEAERPRGQQRGGGSPRSSPRASPRSPVLPHVPTASR
eukprot:TRINITY_DN11107_c0_g1_i1.p1 TRINITY_DN11107_c0_g1~~TRINITY_DN11107_c0_g1_i1.p1  ORF type:complete len:3742 (+),score=1181.92 TRINITY_DN11107_c0_g1_i1:95-11320(+)